MVSGHGTVLCYQWLCDSVTIEKTESLAEFEARSAAVSGLLAFSDCYADNHRQPDLSNCACQFDDAAAFFLCPDLIPPYWTLAYELWFYVVIAAIFSLGWIKRVDHIATGGCWRCCGPVIWRRFQLLACTTAADVVVRTSVHCRHDALSNPHR